MKREIKSNCVHMRLFDYSEKKLDTNCFLSRFIYRPNDFDLVELILDASKNVGE